jgi:hypothetical protein
MFGELGGLDIEDRFLSCKTVLGVEMSHWLDRGK